MSGSVEEIDIKKSDGSYPKAIYILFVFVW